MTGQYFEPYCWTISNARTQKCYVCGSKGRLNIRALTNSSESADVVKAMYDALGLHVKVAPLLPDDRGMPDVLIGACDDHKENLRKLDKSHRQTQRINPKSIEESLI